ncbi:hypothetical protein P4U43_06365 [Arthrobacter sp. EH-1B-1]|uniref:DUF4393 domain-containing protein n=1 Tax=Arthrobacter vasquezii TaxID=2977629 RepID=A0ABT6CU51_9MICC|nr:hypothetical protein [Arthrobacter vasquezii]MDF9277415.1 hypothetical protein [Arthrobacter vasquezii]
MSDRHELEPADSTNRIRGTNANISLPAEVLGLLVGTISPTAGAGIALAGRLVHGMGNRLQQHEDEMFSHLSEGVESSSHRHPEAVYQELMEKPEHLLQLAKAVDAARKSASAEKARSLGNILGELASDDSMIDDASVWIDIFGRIDRIHVRILQEMAALNGSTEPVTLEALANRTGIGNALIPPIHTLLQLGLCRPSNIIDGGTADGLFEVDAIKGDRYFLGPLADELFERLRNAS